MPARSRTCTSRTSSSRVSWSVLRAAAVPLPSPTAVLDSSHLRYKPRSLTPERLRTADFEYHLPSELIAQEPSPDRGGSRLLVVRRPSRGGQGSTPDLLDGRFSDLPALIPPGDLVVLNTTRVRHARLLGSRPSGAPAEVLLIHPGAHGTWVAIGKP